MTTWCGIGTGVGDEVKLMVTVGLAVLMNYSGATATLGIAFAAYVLQATSALQGHATIAASDFPPGF